MYDWLGQELKEGDAVQFTNTSHKGRFIVYESLDGTLIRQRKDERFEVKLSNGKKRYVSPRSLRKKV